jgi:hypothetical protein
VQHQSQAPPTNVVRNSDSSSQSQAHANSAPLASFPEQYGEASDRHVYEIFPQSDNGYGRITSKSSGFDVPVDTHFDTIEPSYLPEGSGISDQQVPTKLGAHYDFNSLFTYESKQTAIQSDKKLQSDWSSGPSCASEPPLQELVYHSDIREAASALLTQSYQGSGNWPLYLAQHNSLDVSFSQYLPSRGVSTISDHEHDPKLSRGPENRPWEAVHQVQKASHEDILYQNEPKPEMRNWVVGEELQAVEPQHKFHIYPHAESKSPAFDVLLDSQNHIESYPPEEEIFGKSDDEMGLDDPDRDAQADPGKTQYDHLKNNDLGIYVALQASQDMQDQRLRTYRSYLDSPNVLTTYQPSARTSPLNDSTAARIFYHFVHVTGPSISLYERHPANPSLMFQGRPVPRSQQHIWACKRISVSTCVLLTIS